MSWTHESRCSWRNVNHATDTALLRCLLLLKPIPRSLKTLTEWALAPFECRIADHALSTQVPFLSYCDAIYACVAAFALKIPLNLWPYSSKTTIHNTQPTTPAPTLPAD